MTCPGSWAWKWSWALNLGQTKAHFPSHWLCKSWAKAARVKELVVSGLGAGRASHSGGIGTRP